MKKIIFLILTLIICSKNIYAIEQNIQSYMENNKFGIMIDNEKITDPIYSKLIRLGENAWIFGIKNKYGIIDNNGNILVEPKFNQAHRFALKFAKLGAKGKYALYNEYGIPIAGHEYTKIEILYGHMFLVEKNYKYGLISYDGDILMAPTADDIYMPEPNVIKIKYNNVWYEIAQKDKGVIELPYDILSASELENKFKITEIVQNPVASAGYGVVSASDYFLKIFSSISPAYEQTIDELILSHGADTANALLKSYWLLKFPYVYGKNYFNNLKAPNNGPLSDIKSDLKSKMK